MKFNVISILVIITLYTFSAKLAFAQNNFTIRFPVEGVISTPRTTVDGNGNFYIAYQNNDTSYILKYSDQNNEIYHLNLTGINNPVITAIASTSNQELYVCGLCYPPSSSIHYRFVCFLDQSGNVVWTKYFQSIFNNDSDRIIVTSNDNAFVFFSENELLSDLVFNTSGTLLQNQTYRHPDVNGSSVSLGAALCSNGDVVVVKDQSYYPMIVRYNSNGQLLWANTITTADSSQNFTYIPSSIIELPTGEFLFGGQCNFDSDSIYLPTMACVTKTDANGHFISTKIFGNTDTVSIYDLYDLQVTGANEVSFTGNSHLQNSFFGKINFNGDLQTLLTSAYTVQVTELRNSYFTYENNNFYFTNFIYGPANLAWLSIAKNTQIDNLICDISTGFTTQDTLYLYFQNDPNIVSNGPYIETGDTAFSTTNVPFTTYYDCSGNTAVLSVDAYTETKSLILYPNPASDFISLTNTNGISALEIYTLNGAQILSQSYPANSTQITLDLPQNLKEGLYLIRVRNSKLQWQNERFILSK